MRTQEEICRDIAVLAHAEVQDQSGNPYIRHPEQVARFVGEVWNLGGPLVQRLEKLGFTRDDGVAAGWLHDVVEDCPDWTLGRMQEMGVNDRVLATVDALTKPSTTTTTTATGKGIESLQRQVGRIVKAVQLGVLLPVLVKPCDNGSNWDPVRLSSPPLSPRRIGHAVNKYDLGSRLLSQALYGDSDLIRPYGFPNGVLDLPPEIQEMGRQYGFAGYISPDLGGPALSAELFLSHACCAEPTARPGFEQAA